MTYYLIIHLVSSPACPKLGSIEAQARLRVGRPDFEQGQGREHPLCGG